MDRRAKHPQELQQQAVELVGSGRGIAEVARSVGMKDGTLATESRRPRPRTRRGSSESERVELQRLRKEVVELRTDRETLRKAPACFARETMR